MIFVTYCRVATFYLTLFADYGLGQDRVSCLGVGGLGVLGNLDPESSCARATHLLEGP